MKKPYIKYIIMTKDEKYWLRDPGKYSPLVRVKTEDDNYTPAMWNSEEDAREDLACYIVDKKKQRFGDFKIVKAEFKYNSLSEVNALPDRHIFCLWLMPQCINKVKVEEMLKQQFKTNPLSFTYKIEEGVDKVGNEIYKVCVENIKWED